MADKNSVDRGLPKKKLATGFIGLALAIARFSIEGMIRSAIDAVIGGIAIISLIFLAVAIIGFITAYDYQRDQSRREMQSLRTQIKINGMEFMNKCEKCSFSHQSLMVGMSAKHFNSITEQRQFYENYITAVLYQFNELLMRLARSEATMVPLIDALLESPMYKVEQSEDLEVWKNFLTNLANGIEASRSQK